MQINGGSVKTIMTFKPSRTMQTSGMMRTAGWQLPLISILLLFVACTPLVGQKEIAQLPPACHAIYDAGSQSTRLYIYEQSELGWIRHDGPRTGALADPAREVRGKTMLDADRVVEDIVMALEHVRFEGPQNKKGSPEWPAFDWQKECSLATVSVFATAGMRLAQEQNPEAVEVLLKKLNDGLGSAVQVPVTTRTLSGFEEGVFAWLAMRESQVDDRFGVAEMGGASIQVTFPCASCDASRKVRARGQVVPVFSHSFLDKGQDEAWKKSGSLTACAWGAGSDNQDWQVKDCAVGMAGFSEAAADVARSVESQQDLRWFLSGAFRYMKVTDIDQFCRLGADSGFEPESSCFRAIYLQEVISDLGLPGNAETTDVDWTLGAVVCTATQCLENK